MKTTRLATRGISEDSIGDDNDRPRVAGLASFLMGFSIANETWGNLSLSSHDGAMSPAHVRCLHRLGEINGAVLLRDQSGAYGGGPYRRGGKSATS